MKAGIRNSNETNCLPVTEIEKLVAQFSMAHQTIALRMVPIKFRTYRAFTNTLQNVLFET